MNMKYKGEIGIFLVLFVLVSIVIFLVVSALPEIILLSSATQVVLASFVVALVIFIAAAHGIYWGLK